MGTLSAYAPSQLLLPLNPTPPGTIGVGPNVVSPIICPTGQYANAIRLSTGAYNQYDDTTRVALDCSANGEYNQSNNTKFYPGTSNATDTFVIMDNDETAAAYNASYYQSTITTMNAGAQNSSKYGLTSLQNPYLDSTGVFDRNFTNTAYPPGACPNRSVITGVGGTWDQPDGQGARIDTVNFQCDYVPILCSDPNNLDLPYCQNRPYSTSPTDASYLQTACSQIMDDIATANLDSEGTNVGNYGNGVIGQTCVANRQALSESSVQSYCQVNGKIRDDPICACYQPAPTGFPTKGATIYCWNQECQQYGFVPSGMHRTCPENIGCIVTSVNNGISGGLVKGNTASCQGSNTISSGTTTPPATTPPAPAPAPASSSTYLYLFIFLTIIVLIAVIAYIMYEPDNKNNNKNK